MKLFNGSAQCATPSEATRSCHYGGGGPGNHLCGAYGAALHKGFGGKYRSSAVGQEKSGEIWVNGVCVGGGFELALACDFVIASRTAKIGSVEVTLGLNPLMGAVHRQVQRAGALRANEMSMLGRRYDAENAGALELDQSRSRRRASRRGGNGRGA